VRTGLSRPWTRAATLATGAHLFYELLAGVAVPFASRLGPVGAAAGWAGVTVAAHRQAGRRGPAWNPVFAVLDGAYLSAVLAHFAGWPRLRSALPWLTECEGLRGPVIAPYNVVLHVSGITAVRGLLENRRAVGALVPLVLGPALVRAQRREYRRLLAQARHRPGWWNRRLQPRAGS
jgi:hypothetical protein